MRLAQDNLILKLLPRKVPVVEARAAQRLEQSPTSRDTAGPWVLSTGGS